MKLPKILKNRKGQELFIGIMVAIMGIIVILQFVTPLKDEVTVARNTSNLDCTNASITTGERSTCILVDMIPFYFIGVAIAAAIGWIALKKIKYEQ